MENEHNKCCSDETFFVTADLVRYLLWNTRKKQWTIPYWKATECHNEHIYIQFDIKDQTEKACKSTK